MEYNGMGRSEMEYNKISLFGFQKIIMEWNGAE
jgi:hypothetical protein